MKYVMFLSGVTVAILMGALARPVRADDCDKLTYLTFSAPVAMPDVTLPAGTYRFSHPDCATTGGILQVSSRDGSVVYGTFATIPDERTTPTDQPEVVFAEMPAGSPEALKEWFYPGDLVGDKLMYRDGKARIVADAQDRTVIAMNGAV